jgi:formylglycine-generating enzyme required for sulfatase activity
MRDSSGNPYPDDTPRPPAAADHTPPALRLQAGLLLDSLGWTPPDLEAFIPIYNTDGWNLTDQNPLNSTHPSFFIARYPLTNLQYKRFLDDSSRYADDTLWRSLKAFDEKGQKQIEVGGDAWTWFNENGGASRKPGYWDDARFGANHRLLPVVGVTWWEAAAYAEWLTRHWREMDDFKHLSELFDGNFTIRLLRESEWVRAAGGEERDRYPWGKTNEKDIQLYANTGESDLGGTSPVGMYPLGESKPHKLMDMGGNVWEWQANLYKKGEDWRAVRGGSWDFNESSARAAARGLYRPLRGWRDFGVRLGVFPG